MISILSSSRMPEESFSNSWYPYGVVFLVILVSLWYRDRKRRMTILQRHGIPVPTPHLIMGNSRESSKKGVLQAYADWKKKYGSIFGYYIGAEPVIVISDPTLIKLITAKDFHNFMDRPNLIPGGKDFHPSGLKMLTRLKGAKWKEVRNLISPSFSSSKLKEMMPMLDGAIEVFLENVEEKCLKDEAFNIYTLFQALTMDIIGRAGFGIETGIQNNLDDEFMKLVREIFEPVSSQKLIKYSFLFPEILPLLLFLRKTNEKIQEWRDTWYMPKLTRFCEKIIEERKRQGESFQRRDLLQVMLEAQVSESEMRGFSLETLIGRADEEKNATTPVNARESASGSQKKQKMLQLSQEEVIANSLLFLEAGFETTSTALAFTMHLLVNHQEVQDKLRQEIRDYTKSGKPLDYTAAMELQYLDCVFSEALRMYPIATIFMSRCALEDYHYKDIVIPKGIRITIALMCIHRDGQYWPQPDKFDPDRFSPERKSEIVPGTYLAFGAGPRNCVGMRLALLEAKLTLARLLDRYKIVPSERTEQGEISLNIKGITMEPRNGVIVKAVPAE